MAVAPVGTPTTVDSGLVAGVDTYTINTPSGVSNGHLLVVTESQQATTVASNTAVWTAMGWSVGVAYTALTGAVQLASATYYKFASSEPSSYTPTGLTNSRYAVTLRAYSGVDATYPFDVTPTSATNASAAVTPPAIVPITSGCMIDATQANQAASGIDNTTYSSSNMTAVTSETSTRTSTANATLGQAYLLQGGAASFSPNLPPTGTPVKGIAFTIALRPAGVIAQVGAATLDDGKTAATTTIVCNKPTGVAVNDVVIFVGWYNNINVATTPSGFQVLHTATQTALAMCAYYRVIDGSEGSSFTMTIPSARAAGMCVAYRGVDTTTLEDVASANTNSASGIIPFPAITPTTAGALVVGFGSIITASGDLTTVWSTTNMDSIVGQAQSKAGAATNIAGAIAHETWSAGAFTPNLTADGTYTRAITISVALRPAPVGGTSFSGTATLTGEGRLSVPLYTAYTYEEGTLGTGISIPATPGVTGVVGTVGQYVATPFSGHGANAVQVDSTAPQNSWYRYGIVGADVHTGSLYLKFDTLMGAVNQIVGFRETGSGASGTALIGQIRQGSGATAGKIILFSGASVTAATSSVTFANGDLCRLDWQFYKHGDLYDMTVRIFKGANVEGTTPDDTISATDMGIASAGLQFGSFTLGLFSANPAVYTYDTFRIWTDTLAWPAPYSSTAQAETGTATLSGSGDLTSVQIPRPTQAAPLSGSGSLAATGVAVTAVVSQAAYRLYNDGSATGAAQLAALNTAYVANLTTGDLNLGVRLRLQETAGRDVPTGDDWQLQWEENASGTWTDVSPEPAQLDRYPVANYDATVFNLTTAGWIAGQSFLGDGQKLTTAHFYLYKQGNPTGNLRAVLYAHTGTYGSGTAWGIPLVTSVSTIDASSVSTVVAGGPFWYRFEFASDFTLSNGATYVIGIYNDTSGDTSNRIRVTADGSSPTHAGCASFYNGTSWAPDTSSDLIFEVRTAPGTPTVVTAHTNPNLTDQEATTQRLGAGTGTFAPGRVSIDGLANNLGLAQGWSGGNYTEVLYALTLRRYNLHNDDALRFRVVDNDTTTSQTYSVFPTINVTLGPAVSQAAYRFYADDGLESAGTALAAQDTAPIVSLLSDVNLRLRLRLQETNGLLLPFTTDWRLQWEKNASGTWTDVTTGGTTVVAYNSVNLTEGGPTTVRLTGATGTNSGGLVSETGLVSDVGLTASNYCELLYSVTLKTADLVDTDTVRFRVLKDGATTDLTYSQTPTITVAEPAYVGTAGLSGSGTLTAGGALPIAQIPTDFTNPDWNTAAGATATSNRLTIPNNGSAFTTTSYSLDGSSVFWNMAQRMTGGTTVCGYWLSILNYTAFNLGSSITCQKVVDGVAVFNNVYAWDPTRTFFRLRELSDEVMFEYSATGAPGTWAIIDSTPAPSYVLNGAPFSFRSTSGSGSAWIENLNQPSTVAYSGTAPLSGDGTLTTVQTPRPVQTAALSGDGSLTTTQVPRPAPVVALSGDGALSSTQAPRPTQAATLSGAGTLSTTQVVRFPVISTLSGDGVLTTVRTVTVAGAATLSGSGTLTAVGAAITAAVGTATLSGDGSLATVQVPRPVVTTALSGAGTLSSTQVPRVAVTVALSGDGILTSVQVPRWAVLVALAGTGVLSTTAVPRTAPIVSLTGDGTLVALRLYAVTTVEWGSSATGTGWVNPANAVGADDTTFATWTSSTASAVSPPLEVSFGSFTAVPADARNISVRVRVKGYWS